jgi:spore coat polysaccharide biosynthesis protein SpsF (cytidylyltransferase family)
MSEAMIKVPTRRADGAWVLRSWSKGQVDLAIDRWEDLRVVARVIEVVTPL